MIPNMLVRWVENCSACGSSHDIEFTRLSDPTVIDGETFGYAGICENTKIKVFLRVGEQKEMKVVQSQG